MRFAAKRGDSKTYVVGWHHVLLSVTYPFGVLALLAAGALVMLADLLLLDTHHITFRSVPKRARSANAPIS